jgi:uncharacterized protein (TIGR00299 family) protein
MAKIAYLDCTSGISGDMTLAALIDAGVPLEALNQPLATLGLPGLRLRTTEVKRRGFRANRVTVDAEPQHHHRRLPEILAMIDAASLTAKQKATARRIFEALAKAEARVHGLAVEDVHFHEVGAADSIADIVGAAVGWDLLGVERIVASAVPTGKGRGRIAHGLCSLPAPATAELLRNIPLAEADTEGEMTTPTGAAILATLVDSFGNMPAMRIERIGYGAGQRDFPDRPNILRLLVGEAAAQPQPEADEVCILETNLDDLGGELVGYCIGRLRKAGALDVYTTAIGMKKDRPAVKITVLCRPGEAALMEDIMFAETTTLGIRRWTARRRVLQRESRAVETPWGAIEGKLSWLADGGQRFSPEYESCRRVAEEHDVPLHVIYDAAVKAFAEG